MTEAVGVALGGLSLLVSAVEHYEQCLRLLKCFGDFTAQATPFRKQLNIQKTIFRNQCCLLLRNVVEQEVARDMLLNQKHPYWIDAEINTQLEKQLEASNDSRLSVIKDIVAVLVKLQSWRARLDKAAEQDRKAHRFGRKAWRSLARTKLWFSFSEQPLNSTMTELKRLNADFMMLSSQTLKLHRQGKSSSIVELNAEDIKRVKSIQKASCEIHEALHETLGRSYSEHPEHRTHLCLEAQTSRSSESLQIQFRIAFSCAAVQGTANVSNPDFLIIESVAHDNLPKKFPDSRSGTTTITAKLKRTLENHDTVPTKKMKQPVKSQGTDCYRSSHQLIVGKIQPLKNLCLNSDFCDRLRKCQQPPYNGIRRLGPLGHTDPNKYMVYLLEKKTDLPALSLQVIISTLSHQVHSKRLSMRERLRLARSLATAVLQYHATPWLKRPWRCKDIYIFGVDEKSLGGRNPTPISEPHIDIRITKSTATSPAPLDESDNPLAANVILFNLGVMLIELAYTATLRDLFSEEKQSPFDPQRTEYLAARELGQDVGGEMGPKYSEIVQKCLGCHFASGADLSSLKLQTEYYRDIVKELEKLEEDFAALTIHE